MAQFDVDPELVKKLAALLAETGLTEIEYAVGAERIRVAKMPSAGPAVTISPPAAPVMAPTAAAPGAQAGPHPGAVTAPMVGTVYLAPEPGAAPFVRPGDTVSEGQTLLMIEAMKTFNPVRAPRIGKVVRILVADGAPVEFGQELVILE